MQVILIVGVVLEDSNAYQQQLFQLNVLMVIIQLTGLPHAQFVLQELIVHLMLLKK